MGRTCVRRGCAVRPRSSRSRRPPAVSSAARIHRGRCRRPTWWRSRRPAPRSRGGALLPNRWTRACAWSVDEDGRRPGRRRRRTAGRPGRRTCWRRRRPRSARGSRSATVRRRPSASRRCRPARLRVPPVSGTTVAAHRSGSPAKRTIWLDAVRRHPELSGSVDRDAVRPRRLPDGIATMASDVERRAEGEADHVALEVGREAMPVGHSEVEDRPPPTLLPAPSRVPIVPSWPSRSCWSPRCARSTCARRPPAPARPGRRSIDRGTSWAVGRATSRRTRPACARRSTATQTSPPAPGATVVGVRPTVEPRQVRLRPARPGRPRRLNCSATRQVAVRAERDPAGRPAQGEGLNASAPAGTARRQRRSGGALPGRPPRCGSSVACATVHRGGAGLTGV